MKKILSIIALVVLLTACALPNAKTGRAVFAITDAAASMGAVTSVKVTVDSVRVHGASDSWTTVTSAAQTYDLLALKAQGSTVALADVQLASGTYDQVRLDISKVVVTDANGTHEAKLPSGELKIVGKIVVAANTTSAVTFDFIADRSLHVTGNGSYILAPVVHLKTHSNADVEVDSDDEVRVSGGHVDSDEEVGMDEHGNVGVGLKIDTDADVEIENGEIKVGLGGKSSAKGNASVHAEI
jgi:hypothetical protein